VRENRVPPLDLVYVQRAPNLLAIMELTVDLLSELIATAGKLVDLDELQLLVRPQTLRHRENIKKATIKLNPE